MGCKKLQLHDYFQLVENNCIKYRRARFTTDANSITRTFTYDNNGNLNRKIDKQKIKALNNIGIHVKYELVTNASNDNSMSNYIALYKRHSGYINIEAESSDTSTQKKMIDRVMKLIYQGSL